jgi:hypothetical protein
MPGLVAHWGGMPKAVMRSEAELTERTEPDGDTSMDGGLRRLDPPGLAELDDDEVVAPRHEKSTTDAA